MGPLYRKKLVKFSADVYVEVELYSPMARNEIRVDRIRLELTNFDKIVVPRDIFLTSDLSQLAMIGSFLSVRIGIELIITANFRCLVASSIAKGFCCRTRSQLITI